MKKSLKSVFSDVNDDAPKGTYYTFLINTFQDKETNDMYLGAIRSITPQLKQAKNVSVVALHTVTAFDYTESSFKRLLKRINDNKTTEHVVVMGNNLNNFFFEEDGTRNDVMSEMIKILQTSPKSTAHYISTDPQDVREHTLLHYAKKETVDRFDWQFIEQNASSIEKALMATFKKQDLIKSPKPPKPSIK